MTPEMRASFIQENLAAAEGLDRAILEAFPADCARIIRAAHGNDWLDVTLDLQLTECIHAVLGDEGLREVNRSALLSSFEGPLFGSLFAGAVRLFGATPMALLRWAPRGFSSVYRHAGYWRVDAAAKDGATIIWGSLPDLLLDSEPYLDGVCGVLEGAARALRHEAEVELKIDRGLHLATYEIAWRAG